MAEHVTANELTHEDDLNEDQHLVRRWMGRAGIVLAGGLIGATAGFGYAIDTPTETHVAGLDASVEIMDGDMSQVDMAVGSIKIPTDINVAGKDLAARITIHGVSEDSEAQNFNSNTLGSFLQLFSDPEHDIATVRDTVINRLWQLPLYTGLGVMGAEVLTMSGAAVARRSMSDERREAFSQAFHAAPKTKFIAGATATAIAFGGISGYSIAALPDAPHASGTPDKIFDNTPLQGAEISGLVKPIVDNAAPAIEKYIKDNDTFYDMVRGNVKTQFETVIGVTEKQENEHYIVVASDRHCNVGMDRVIAEAAKLYGADTYVSAGDDNMSGTVSIESACTSGLAQRLIGEHVTPVVAPGNHDSPQTIKDEESQGYKVLEHDKIITVNGITFIGDADPRRSAFGHPLTPGGAAGDKVIAKEGQDLANAAAKSDKPIDIGVVHEPNASDALIKSGLARLVIRGHTHSKKGPFATTGENGQATYYLTEGTTGGAKEDSLTLGPLKTAATLSVYRFNTGTKVFQYSNITVKPDMSVTITPFADMPAVPHVLTPHQATASDKKPKTN